MTPADLYPTVRAVHIGLVLISGALFALRGAAVLARARWPLARPARRLSVAIDTALVAAALALLAMLELNPFTVPWLASKLALLLVYIVLGSLALKRARSLQAKAMYYVAALLCFGLMLTVALSHHPLGALRTLAD